MGGSDAVPALSYYEILGVDASLDAPALTDHTYDILHDEKVSVPARARAAFVWEALCDPEWRATYDRVLAAGGTSVRAPRCLVLRPLVPGEDLGSALGLGAVTSELASEIPPASSSPLLPDVETSHAPALPGEPPAEGPATEVSTRVAPSALSRLQQRLGVLGEPGRALLTLLLPIYLALAFVCAVRFAHPLLPLAWDVFTLPGLPGFLAALALGTSVWAGVELPRLSRMPWRLRAWGWGGGTALVLCGGAPLPLLVVLVALGALAGEGVRSSLDLHPAGPRATGDEVACETGASVVSGSSSTADEPVDTSPSLEAAGISQPLLAALRTPLPLYTATGLPWGAPSTLTAPLRAQMQAFSLPPKPVALVDEVAAVVGLEAWMFCTGSSTLRSATQYGSVPLGAISAVAARASGQGDPTPSAPLEDPVLHPQLTLALRGWARWALEYLSPPEAALAFRLAASDLAWGGGFGDELSRVASTIFAAADTLQLIPAEAG